MEGIGVFTSHGLHSVACQDSSRPASPGFFRFVYLVSIYHEDRVAYLGRLTGKIPMSLRTAVAGQSQIHPDVLSHRGCYLDNSQLLRSLALPG